MAAPAVNPAEIVDRNLRAAMRLYSLATKRGEARDYPGLTVVSSGVDFSVFNSAMFTEPVEEAGVLERHIAQASVHFHARGVGWSVWASDNRFAPKLGGGVEIFTRHGLRRIASPPGMHCDCLAPRERAPAALDCRPVADERTRATFAEVAALVFAVPYLVARAIYGGAEIWSGTMRGYVGYFEDAPCSIVAVVVAAEAAGIYSLGTLPQHRGRGFGETLMRFALEQTRAETGIGRTVLQATKAGMPLYRRLGYRVVSGVDVYVCEGCG